MSDFTIDGSGEDTAAMAVSAAIANDNPAIETRAVILVTPTMFANCNVVH